MKFINLAFFGISIVLLNSSTLFAQNNSKVIDSKKAASLSADQIDQQAKITENYKLGSVNNDNQGDYFHCRLMMNSSGEGVEKAIERLINGEIESLIPEESRDLENVKRVERFSVFPSAAVSSSSHQISTISVASHDEEIEIDDALPLDEAMTIEQQFKDAVTAYPDTSRLIVKESNIVPPDPNSVSNNNDRENQEIMRLLKNVITVCYSSKVANGIDELSPLAFVSARDLSAKKISEILQRCDASRNNTTATTVAENGGNFWQEIERQVNTEVKTKKTFDKVNNDLAPGLALSSTSGAPNRGAPLTDAEQSDNESEEVQPITLEDFKNVLHQYPYAIRFTIEEEEEGGRRLQAQANGKDLTRGIHGGKNREIIGLLRALLITSYPQLYDRMKFDDFFQVDPKKNAHPSLSAEKLKAIFEKIDQIARPGQKEQKFQEYDVTTLGDHSEIMRLEKESMALLLQNVVSKSLEKASALNEISKKLAIEAVNPPIESFEEEEWYKWAKHLLQTGNGDSSKLKLLADYGLSDPLWAMQQVQIEMQHFFVSIEQLTLRLLFQNLGGLREHQLPTKKATPGGQEWSYVFAKTPMDADLVLPTPESPQILDKFYEVQGGALLRHARTIPLDGSSLPQQENMPVILLSTSSQATQDNQIRWSLSSEIEELLEERDQLLAESQTASLLSTKATKGNGDTATVLPPSGKRQIFRFATPRSLEEEKATPSEKKRKSETDTESCITSVTKQTTRSQSIYSHTSEKSKFSTSSSLDEVKAKLNSVLLKSLKLLDRKVTKCADQWTELVRKADAERRSKGGGTFPDESTLFDAWQDADEKAQKADKERQNKEQALASLQRRKEEWDVNTRRWEARAKADLLMENLIQEKEVKALLDGQYGQEDRSYIATLKNEYQGAEEEWIRLAIPSILQGKTTSLASDALKEWLKMLLEKCHWNFRKKELAQELSSAQEHRIAAEKFRNQQDSHWQAKLKDMQDFDKTLQSQYNVVSKNFKEAKERLEKWVVSPAFQDHTDHTEREVGENSPITRKEIERSTKDLFTHDQAIHFLWKKFNNLSDAEIEKAEVSKKFKASELNKNVGMYQSGLKEEKRNWIDHYFKEANKVEKAAQAARTTYFKNRTPEHQKEVQVLYAKADELEQQAQQAYEDQLLSRALQDAYKKEEFAEQAWKSSIYKGENVESKISSEQPLALSLPSVRKVEVETVLVVPAVKESFSEESDNIVGEGSINQQLQQHIQQNIHTTHTLNYAVAMIKARANIEEQLKAEQEAEVIREKFTELLLKEYDPVVRNNRHWQSIAKADQKALEKFQEAVKEFSDIKAIWKMQHQDQGKKEKWKILEAVFHYHTQKKRELWDALTHQEQKEYNEEIVELNEGRHDRAVENIQKARKELGKVQVPSEDSLTTSASYRTGVSQKIKKEKRYCIKLWAEEDERLRALRWGKLETHEREEEWKSKQGIHFYQEAITKEEIFHSREKEFDENKPESSSELVTELLNYLSEQIHRGEGIVVAWENVSKNFKMGSCFLPDLAAIDQNWIDRCESGEQKVKEWTQKLLELKASKADLIAMTAIKKIMTVPNGERAPLWEESQKRAQEAEEALNQSRSRNIITADSSVTSEETRWAHWMATADDLTVDDPEGNGLCEKAKGSFSQAIRIKTKDAWLEALQSSQALLAFLERENNGTALLKMQRAIWRERIKMAATKVALINLKNLLKNFLPKLQEYMDHADLPITAVYDAGAIKVLESLHDSKQEVERLRNIDLSRGARASVIASATASALGGSVVGGVAGGVTIGLTTAILPLGAIALPAYIATKRVQTADGTGEIAAGIGVGVGTAVAGGVGLGISSWAFALMYPLISVGGLFYGGYMAAEAATEYGYDDVYASKRSAEVLRSVADAEALDQVIAASLEVFHNAFFKTWKKIPTKDNVNTSIEAAVQTVEKSTQTKGTPWEEEGDWLAKTAKVVAAFNNAVRARALEKNDFPRK